MATVLEKVKGFFRTCGKGIVKGARATKKGWKAGWDFLEQKSVPLHEIYEVRDFKGLSAYGILFAILSMFFGIFFLAINMGTMRLEIGATLFNDIGEFFVFVSLICFIVGIVTTTDAGIIFLSAGYLLPFVGEVLTLLWNLVTGNFVPYIVANWLFLALYAVIAVLPLLTYFKVLAVKWHRFIFPLAMLLFLAGGIVLLVFGLPPFLNTAANNAAYTYVTDLCEYITYLISIACITVTIFGANDKVAGPITVVKLKEEQEEF